MFSARNSLFLAAVFAVVNSAGAADPSAVKAAIDKGAAYLQKLHAPSPNYTGGEYGAGTAALAGLALLEAEVKRDDTTLLNIAQFIRTQGLSETATYRVSLSLIFLDKYGDPRDVPLIQVLGIRLYAGMNAGAGWTYPTWPTIPPVEAARLANALTKPFGTRKLHPEAGRQYQAVRATIAATGRTGLGAGDDNSNTQFGLIGLWVAARHGVPVSDAIAALEGRFLRSQNRADGGWGYSMADASTPAMTCAGLLGLAAGSALRESIKSGKPFGGGDSPPLPSDLPAAEGAAKEKEKKPDPFANPHKQTTAPVDPGLAAPAPPPEPEAEADNPALRNNAVQAALAALGRTLSAMSPPGGANPTPGTFSNYVGHGNYLYVLWSIERVGVIYGLDTIGDVNWYDLGSAVLLNSQAADGSWGAEEKFAAPANTPLAILFLSKANLVAEMSRNLKGKHKDPGRSELRGGGAPPIAAPARPEPAAPFQPPDPPPEVAGALPEVKDTGEAIRRAVRLAASTDEEWPDRLVELRDSKGAMNTLALARAAATLEGVRRKQARDTLADRFVRMTPATLRGLLRDPDPEIRRAAALACGMKEDQGHVPDLIDRLTDPSDIVGRAARAALRALTGKDFGPEPGASDDAKVKAAEDWRTWSSARRPRGS